MTRTVSIVAWLAMASSTMAQDAPGSLNANVTQDNIHSTICVIGWTKTVRPSRGITSVIKRRMMEGEGLYDMRRYELDHVIPLELGGAPLDPKNLQLQPWGGSCSARDKDALEHELSRRVCAGQLTLAEAQRRIAADWEDAYGDFVDPQGCERE